METLMVFKPEIWMTPNHSSDNYGLQPQRSGTNGGMAGQVRETLSDWEALNCCHSLKASTKHTWVGRGGCNREGAHTSSSSSSQETAVPGAGCLSVQPR